MTRTIPTISLLFLALLATGPLFAQATSGSILGALSDASGARVPNVLVNIQNQSTGSIFAARSNADGIFAAAQLPPGPYRIEIQKDGFKTINRTGIVLHVDEQLRLDLTLAVRGPEETIEITGAPGSIQDQNSTTGVVMESRQILDLPLLGRNFLDLTLLAPGVTAGAGGNISNYSVNGQREFANSILVNGVEVTGNRNNDTHVLPSVDAVEEFRTLTSGYAPEFGRSGAGVVAIQTRSGSNQFHGSAFEFLRTNATTARTPFAAASGLKENDFGATLGGPLHHNRTFFFVSYEGQRQRDLFSYLDTTVPAGMIQVTPGGNVDLSGLRDPLTGKQVPIFDPNFYNTNYYSQPFAGNIIPAARVSPAGLHVLQNLFPKPNAPGILNGWFNNFQVAEPYQFGSDIGDLRLDHAFTDRDRVSLTYDVYDFHSRTADPFAGSIPIAGGGGADIADQTDSGNHSIGLSYARIFSPSQVNELRASFFHTPLSQRSLLSGNLSNQLGIGGVNLPGFPATEGLPQIDLAFGALAGGSTYKPLTFEDNNFAIGDSFTWTRGRHTFKYGYEYRHLEANPNFSLFPTGFQYYYGAYASLTSDPTYSFYDASAYYGNGGNEIADLLLGLPGYVAQGLQLTNPRTTSFEHHFFVQDAWRLSSRLTLTYGVRYEYQASYREAQNHQANFDPASMSLLLAGAGANSPTLINPDRNNFAPRLGLAWQLTPRTVIRSAYGIYYTPENSARSDVLTKNYPFFYQQTLFNSPGVPFSYLLDTGVARPLRSLFLRGPPPSR